MKSVMYDMYEVYEDGTIINVKSGREMSQRVRDKRKEVRLNINGVRRNFITSRLVYWLFNEDFDISNKNLCVVADDMINFTLEDLRVVARKDLIQGDKHKEICKLTDIQVAEIKSLYSGKPCVNQYDKSGISYMDIAKKYGVTKALIAQIVRGEVRDKDKYKLK